MGDNETALVMHIFFEENDEYEGKPLGEFLLHFLLQHHVGGATLLRAEAGFGSRRHIQHPNNVGSLDDVPMVLIAVEKENILRPLLPEIRRCIGDHVVSICKTEQF